MHTIIEQAQKELIGTGCLRVSARQQLWLALGPAEVNEQHPGPLTEAVRKRAQLALRARTVQQRQSASAQ